MGGLLACFFCLISGYDREDKAASLTYVNESNREYFYINILFSFLQGNKQSSVLAMCLVSRLCVCHVYSWSPVEEMDQLQSVVVWS